MNAPGRKRHRGAALQVRKERVLAMYLENKTQDTIAKVVGVTQARVSQYIKEALEEVKARTQRLAEDKIAEEVAKLSHIEHEAFDSWSRSKEDDVTVTTRKVRPKKEKDEELGKRLKKADKELLTVSQEEKRQGQAGDPAYLHVAASCIRERLKLMGAYPKEDKTETTNVIQINWGDLSKPIPNAEVIDVTPSSEIEARIAAELESHTSPQNGNGKA